ncbi:MAG: type IV pilus modification protein PilV [Thiobacillus sp.]
MRTRIQIRRQRGVSLLEVLISVVVLSVGLLGLAGLQAVTLKNNTSAYQRSLATMMAYDVIDRIRADLPNRANYVVAMNAAGAGNVLLWKNGVKADLPDGNASVAISVTEKVTVTIQWDDNRDGVPIQMVTETNL